MTGFKNKGSSRRRFIQQTGMLGASALLANPIQLLAQNGNLHENNDIKSKSILSMKKAITFKNKALKIAAHLHLPDNFKEDQKYPPSLGFIRLVE